MADLVTQACGAGGITEMAAAITDKDLPLFGILRLTVGSGTFARQKVVFISYMPETAGPLKKAKVRSCLH